MEIDPELQVERRTLFFMPVAWVGARLAFGEPIVGSQSQPAAELSLDTFSPLDMKSFGEAWLILAKKLRTAGSEIDDTYAAQLAGLIGRVPIEKLPKLEKEGGGKAGLLAGPTWRLLPCVTIEFKLEADAEIRLHNHPPQVVVTLCAEGEVDYQHYEIEGEAPSCLDLSGKQFKVRRTRSGVLRPGRLTSVTRAHDGMHMFKTTKRAARLIDFTVSTTDDSKTFSYVKLSKEPVEAERGVFEASWTGKT